MKSTAEILELLRVFKAQSAAKYGLRRIGIFGSVARGEQTNQVMLISAMKANRLHFLL